MFQNFWYAISGTTAAIVDAAIYDEVKAEFDDTQCHHF